MAKVVDIKNFRAFRSVSLPDCRRINLVVGENGSGKTALLEALFLVCGSSPELALRLKAWRGFENTAAGNQEQVNKAIWGDLFYDFDQDEQVWIRLSGEEQHNRTLRIFRAKQQEAIQISKKTPIRAITSHTIRFHWRGPYKNEYIDDPSIEDGKLKFSSREDSPIPTCFFAANQTYSTSETVSRFSELSKANRKPELLSEFAQQFDFVDDLSIEMSGGTPMVFAKIRGMSNKIPINLVSGGMNKLAAILFAFPTHKNEIVIIDEIENGFYYKRFQSIWNSIFEFAETYNVQIFASTHSYECINYATKAATERSEEFSLIRSVREEGRSILRQFDGTDFSTLLYRKQRQSGQSRGFRGVG